MFKFLRKYNCNSLKNKQKRKKNHFFNEKKCLKAHFCTKKQIFFVILRPKEQISCNKRHFKQ